MTSTLNGENQITLPAEVLKELHLESRSQIEWSTTEDGALLGRRLEMTRGQLARHLLGRVVIPSGNSSRIGCGRTRKKV